MAGSLSRIWQLERRFAPVPYSHNVDDLYTAALKDVSKRISLDAGLGSRNSLYSNFIRAHSNPFADWGSPGKR